MIYLMGEIYTYEWLHNLQMCNLLCINRDGSDGVLGKLHEVAYIGKCHFHRISGNSRYACVVQRMKMAFNS